jgi:hydrogenase maturation protein HypF
MRAYTPLHWLILHALAGKPESAAWREAACDIALVATSANLAGEPLIADDAEARAALAGVADLVVGHARAIVARADDSVMRVLDGAPAYLRRARGVAPDPVDLGRDGPSVLAQGGDLKNTFCLTRGREAFVSPYLGDLDDLGTIRFRDETIRHLQALLGIEPEVVVCDLHPDFVSTRTALADGRPVVRVQHHVAHVAACAAEHGWTGAALGVALDGFGLGSDGGAWGGELIALDGASWRRVGHLEPLALPGGDKAAREPWRMGVAALHKLGRGGEAARRFAGVAEAGRLAEALARGARFGVTTSLGRVFDAAAALSGVCMRQAYEGEAAMRLEAWVGALPAVARCWRIVDGRLDLTPLLALLPEASPREAAELFHAGLVGALAEWIGEAARREGLTRVALGGGCVMNGVLTDGLCAALRAQGLVVALPRKLPANDGGLSFGQAAFALAGLR